MRISAVPEVFASSVRHLRLERPNFLLVSECPLPTILFVNCLANSRRQKGRARRFDCHRGDEVELRHEAIVMTLGPLGDPLHCFVPACRGTLPGYPLFQ